MKRIALLSVILMLIALTGLAHAQSGSGYDLTWYTIDGGGGSSSGGGYTLQGTVGQPDTGLWAGSDYVLLSGFWGGGVTHHRIYLPLILRH
jgi:hypothetical protein